MAAYRLPFDPCFVAAALFACGKILLIGRERQTPSASALTLVKEERSPVSYLHKLPLYWKMVEKRKIHYASTKAKGKQQLQGNVSLKGWYRARREYSSLYMNISSFIFQESTYLPDTMPLHQEASKSQFTNTATEPLLLTHRFWSYLFPRGTQTVNMDITVSYPPSCVLTLQAFRVLLCPILFSIQVISEPSLGSCLVNLSSTDIKL